MLAPRTFHFFILVVPSTITTAISSAFAVSVARTIAAIACLGFRAVIAVSIGRFVDRGGCGLKQSFNVKT
jgi:hypothetical protein